MLIYILFSIALTKITRQNLKELYSQNQTIDFQVESGYATNLQQENNNGLFYQLVYQKGFDETKITQNNILIIWFQGGPGCTSQIGLYNEIGPFIIQQNDVDFTIKLKQQNSWNDFASLLFIDQPIGTGFSYGETVIKSTQQASLYIIEFMKEFYNIHQEFKQSPTYLAGTGYAGHFVPYFAQQLIENQVLLNYSGIIIGNGIFSVFQQVSSQSQYLLVNGILDQQHKQFDNKLEAYIQQLILQNQEVNVGMEFERYHNDLIQESHVDLDNISLKSKFLQDVVFLAFMNKYKDKFGIQNIVKDVCQDNIQKQMYQDVAFDTSQNIQFLLNQGTILIYQGQMDGRIAITGLYNWIITLKSQEIQDWKNQQKKIFKINEQTVGTLKKSEKFTFVTIYNVGHNSIEEKPEVLYEMIKHHLKNDEYWN